MMEIKYGKICKKHPELKGKRYVSNRHCVECIKNISRVYYKKHKAALLAKQQLKRSEPEMQEKLKKQRKDWYALNRELHISNVKKAREKMKNENN